MLLNFRIWRLFWEEDSLSSLRNDFVLDNLDLAGDFPSDLERAQRDFDRDVLGYLGDFGSLGLILTLSREEPKLEPLYCAKGWGLARASFSFLSFPLFSLSLPCS